MKLPFFNELNKAQNILIAGAGGGFDVFCGLPLYFWLKKAGKSVHLANLSSIIAAITGSFGDIHPTKRTEGSKLFINPLMGLFWSFKLENVARRNLYLDQIRDTDTTEEVALAIEKFRDSLPKTRPWTTIPC